MSLNSTPSSERVHIGIFGRRNAGKSSLINALTGQETALVSDVMGTTTDPVTRTMEILPLGPCVIIDTPGLDDRGSLGEMRVKAALRVLNRVDMALVVIDGREGITKEDEEILSLIKGKEIPYLVVCNKADLLSVLPEENEDRIWVSALKDINIYRLREKMAHLVRENDKVKPLVSDLIAPLDRVVLVIPIDGSAPKGRIILPQQMVIRDLLEAGAVPICVRDTELAGLLAQMAKVSQKPALVITDSQAFAAVKEIVPEEIPLTSFSILMARYRGFLREAVKGAKTIDRLKDGDRILISEGCTHHRQCEDIGTVKLPAMIRKRTGADIRFDTSSGGGFPEDLSAYALVLHCGACMLNEREVLYRMKCAGDAGLPFTNYGTAIAYMQGILQRSLEILKL